MSDNAHEKMFSTALAQLNQQQRRAVEAIEGPVLVVAGPGTGKTQILTLRIANILRCTDVAPESVLALTFTDSGAHAMRSRLRQYIGTAAYRVPIFTFHGFAQQLIRNYPDAYTRVVGGVALNDLEGLQFIEEILDGGEYSNLRPLRSPQYYVKPIRDQISAMKREYVSPDRLAQQLAEHEVALQNMPRVHKKGPHKGKVRGDYTKSEKMLARHRELLQVYRSYEAMLEDRRRYDFSDMIIETVHVLEHHESLRRELQETYHYILADEHQDVNESQNQILALLASYHEQPNIFVVGDEKQAIYRFQGASLANFLYFGDRFAGTTTIQLTDNYRSGQDVLDVAHELIQVDDPDVSALRVPLHAASVTDAHATLRTFSHEVTEEEWVLQSVEEHIQSGVHAKEIAIIVRTNRQVEHFASRLRSRGISTQASADGDINAHPITHTIRALIQGVVNGTSEVSLARLLHEPYWGLTQADIFRVLTARTHARPLTVILADEAILYEIGVSEVAAVARIQQVLDAARDRLVYEPPHRVLEHVLQESGLLAHIETTDPWEGGRVIRRLYDTVEQLVQTGQVTHLSDVPKILERYEMYGVPLAAPYIATQTDAVHVMTAHKAKGLEFGYVYIPRLTDTQWGGGRNAQLFKLALTNTSTPGDVEDDDRRLLYVAMTRAKHTLFLSYPLTDGSGKERILTRLCTDGVQELLNVESTREFEASVSLPRTLEGELKPVQINSSLLYKTLSERGFSATSMNNYLKDPWNFVYRNVLRVPEVKPIPMLYGTVVHDVLEQLVRRNKTNANLSTSVSEYIRHALMKTPLTAEEFSQLHEKALHDITAYLPRLEEVCASAAWSVPEVSVSVTMATPYDAIPEIPLTGTLDRIDYMSDRRVQRVVDYKTGKPKTRNEIEGRTAAQDASYKRQLCFYAVLLQERGEYHEDIEFVLSFVEPKQGSHIREEVFYITPTDIEEIRQTLQRIVSEVIDGTCLQKPCNPDKCDYCDWVEKLRTAHELSN
jgi:DNA helicase-2/ATP-dependent DNA helicase PcrA